MSGLTIWPSPANGGQLRVCDVGTISKTEKVNLGQNVTINFEGTPPFLVSQAFGVNNGFICDGTNQTINTNTFNWTVKSVTTNYTTPNTLAGPGQATWFIAVQTNQNASNLQYTTSSNYTIQSSGSDKVLSVSKVLVACLALSSLLLV